MNNGDKRKVSTDALETLGMIIDENEKRDAIHLAVEPVMAGQTLAPGQDIGLVDGIAYIVTPEKQLGIVDPFLKEPVKAGQRFWLVVYPRQIQSLRHVWTHPAFPDETVHINGEFSISPTGVPMSDVSGTVVNLALQTVELTAKGLATELGVKNATQEILCELVGDPKMGLYAQKEKIAILESEVDKLIHEKKISSEKWLRKFIEESECLYDYDYVMKCVNVDDQHWMSSGDSMDEEIPDEFWDHMEIVTGKKITNRYTYFSCAC